MLVTPKNRILFIVAHPFLKESRSNRAVVEAVADLPGVTVHSLYDLYPYFHIDGRHERELLAAHDMIVVQHPFYWYSMPALMRHWQTEVLQRGWAYGAGGDKLKGKDFLASVTLGGPADSYAPDGYNRFTMDTYLAPWNQTAHLCQMNWHKPVLLYSSVDGGEDRLRAHGQSVRRRLADYLGAGH
jgi:putative NADPH-quinone reductase